MIEQIEAMIYTDTCQKFVKKDTRFDQLRAGLDHVRAGFDQPGAGLDHVGARFDHVHAGFDYVHAEFGRQQGEFDPPRAEFGRQQGEFDRCGIQVPRARRIDHMQKSTDLARSDQLVCRVGRQRILGQ